MLTLHASAFILYLVAAVVYFGTETYSFFAQTESALTIAYIGILFFDVANFVAQALLVAIFWDLGKNKPTTTRDTDSQRADSETPSINS